MLQGEILTSDKKQGDSLMILFALGYADLASKLTQIEWWERKAYWKQKFILCVNT